MAAATRAEAREAAPEARVSPATAWIAPGAVLGGSLLLAAASALPVWASRLNAPQYPQGLWLWAYGGWVEGDLGEINGLNHYVGMRPFEPSVVPEMVLWLPMLVGLTVLLALAVYVRSRVGLLALIGLWLAPLVVLADIQRWLIVFGTDLDPTAALRLDPYIPWVVGPTQVWNFTVWGFPGPGLLALAVVAAIATFARRRPAPPGRLQAATMAAGVGLVVIAAAWVALTNLAPTVSAAALPRAPVSPVADAAGFDLAEAVATSEPGATLHVPPGTYRVNLVIDRPLELLGHGQAIIDGGGRGQVVRIEADGVTLDGFRIVNSGGQVEEGAGVLVHGSDAWITGNRIERSYVGVSIQDAADVRVAGNTIIGSGQVMVGADHAVSPGADAGHTDHAGHADDGTASPAQGDGVSVWNASGILVRDNTIRLVRDAIYLAYADQVLVDTNVIEESRYAVHTMFGGGITIFGNRSRENLSGLVLMYSHEVVVGRNEITDSQSAGTGFGILLKDVQAPQLRGNVVARNRVGLQAEGTAQAGGVEASVVANRFASNRVGVALMASADLAFSANSFDRNLTQVLALERGVSRQNVWSYHGVGNAWSDYVGFDTGDDGTGDVPYTTGGAHAALLARSPALELLVTTPAFHLLSASQAWWSSSFEPAVVDPRPLTAEVAPPVTPAREADGLGAWAGIGILLVALPMTAALRLGSDRHAAA